MVVNLINIINKFIQEMGSMLGCLMYFTIIRCDLNVYDKLPNCLCVKYANIHHVII